MPLKGVTSYSQEGTFTKVDLKYGQAAIAIITQGASVGFAIAAWRGNGDPLIVSPVLLTDDVTATASGNSFVISTRWTSLVAFLIIGK